MKRNVGPFSFEADINLPDFPAERIIPALTRLYLILSAILLLAITTTAVLR